MRVDREATVAMNFADKDSYVALDGRHIYNGVDATIARAKAWATWDGKCGRCSKLVAHGAEDWEHVIPKGSHGMNRDDHPRNRRFVHGMFAKEACHRDEHNREVRWSRRVAAQEAGANG